MTEEAIHPGELLTDELEVIEITVRELARQIDMPPALISSQTCS